MNILDSQCWSSLILNNIYHRLSKIKSRIGNWMTSISCMITTVGIASLHVLVRRISIGIFTSLELFVLFCVIQCLWLFHLDCLQLIKVQLFSIHAWERAYADNHDFRKKCDMLSVNLIYEHQQQEHINLMSSLESVPDQFHKLQFHSWIHNNTPLNALTKKAHKMSWHQILIHMAPKTIQ